MKTLLINLKPFTFTYDIFLISDSEVKTIAKTSIKNLPEVICEVARTNECNNIKINGKESFVNEIINKIQNTFVAKYNKDCSLIIENIHL